MSNYSLELKCVNTIRAVSADQPQAANSGHPGAPMGCAPMAYLLWAEVMKYSSKDPAWINRDRFVLSNGHACALQYTMLHLTGYNVGIEDLKKFRKIGSITPGHPECFATDGRFFVFFPLFLACFVLFWVCLLSPFVRTVIVLPSLETSVVRAMAMAMAMDLVYTPAPLCSLKN